MESSIYDKKKWKDLLQSLMASSDKQWQPN